MWVSVNKKDWGKTYDWQVEKWTLDERGEWAKYDFNAGQHEIELAGRSPGFAIDQILIFEESRKNQFVPIEGSSHRCLFIHLDIIVKYTLQQSLLDSDYFNIIN